MTEKNGAKELATKEWAADILTCCCQILDVVKNEWKAEDCWSTWDQTIRDDCSRWLKEFHASKSGVTR